ncbi:MAG: protein phosphatase 2C domain-containing protein [Paludisphaera borealis]|uniref:PP2C family protein-serine/threonine phosphatase n=1 Tax=Paludisphaera borealis TaxID=1387353 RepID=UPI00283DB860|nr:protein phosphatase 2C domain-containing protein [Paludisphaera borealis]MDR3621540.1 protein phosphatase 2C domain-containing protein [Paludisphaera borealis]
MSACPVKIETAEYEFLVSPLSTGTRAVPKEPHSTAVRVDLGAVSHPGRVRQRNEDHFMVAKVSRTLEVLLDNLPQGQLPHGLGEDGYSMVVADGMGGMNAGDVASMLAISTGLKLADKSVKWGFKINEKEARELLERMSMYFQEIDRRLTSKSESDRRLFGMGTTMTLAYSVGSHLFLIHVGDSRAYLYRGGVLTQLTRDHTVAQALADAGQIKEEEVRQHARRNTLTNYLGGHRGKIKADVRWLRIEDGDQILLCSDGLSDMVEDPAIAASLARREPSQQAAQTLLDMALDNGGRDNITIIVAGYSIPKPENEAVDHLQPSASSGEPTEEFPVYQGPKTPS